MMKKKTGEYIYTLLNEVLAKKEPKETLIQHTENLLSVFESIRSVYPEAPQIATVPDFYEHLFYSICLHDLGKVAIGFQEKWGNWGYRHEILSAGFVKYLPNLDNFHKRAIALAIITHHKDINELRHRFNTITSTGKDLFIEKRKELEDKLEFIKAFFLDIIPNWSKFHLNKSITINGFPSCVMDIEDSYKFSVDWFWRLTQENEKNELHSNYGILLRGLLISCDHLASSGKTDVLMSVKEINRKLGINNFRSFQRNISNVNTSAFLSAPTGSGKTEGGLLWAEKNIGTDKRIYYVLPYTASINAMYKRLVKYFGEEYVAIIHSKASYFIYNLLLDRENISSSEALRKTMEIEGLARKVYRPIKVLTPFQIIKFFFGIKGWESAVAEMIGSVFIFDEIHVYNPNVTALILVILKKLREYNCKILFMSATFPIFLKEKILKIFPDIIEVKLEESDESDKQLLIKPRHKIEIINGEITEHIDYIKNELLEGKKVLVVCNTVKRAQEIFTLFDIDNKELLHGRFILRDRENIERRVTGNIPNLLVATQVVEVSLDISFDTIFSEPAPIDALIQRFGRINRNGNKGTVPVRIFTVGSARDKYFYDNDRIDKTLSVFHNGLELNERIVPYLVEEVYSMGYNAKEGQLFNNTSQAFENVVSDLIPFFEDEDKDDFYDMIKSYQVIPSGEIEQDYLELLSQKKYFEAVQCFATISVGQSARLSKLSAFSKRLIKIDNKEHTYYTVNCEYSKELGLLLDSVTSQGVIID